MNDLTNKQNNSQGFFYDRQIKRYLGMFMAIFTGFQVKTGRHNGTEFTMIDVPIAYGSKDRVAAAVQAGNTQNKPLRLPVCSAYMSNMRMAPERAKGLGITRNTPHMPNGGVFPDDVTSLAQRMPVPYNLTVQLTVHTSNMDQHVQLLEQILVMFDPSIEIQRSDSLFDWAKNVTVTLDEVRLDENYPSGIDRRNMQSTLIFTMPIWLEVPAAVYDNLVRSVNLRISAISDLADFIDNVSIAEDEDYETVGSVNDLSLG